MEQKIENIIVVKILEEDRIVINKGSNDGIFENMRFLVYEQGEEIMDPLTKKSLGVLENPKGTFKVMHLQENMAVLISELKRPSKIALTFSQFSEINAERDLLKTIRIGDKVKIIN